MKSLALSLLLACAGAGAAPLAGVPATSEIGFSVSQMGVAVSGKFTRFDARIDLDALRPEASSAEVSVDVTSLTTGDGEADATATDRPWLDAKSHPKASFKSSSVRALGPGRFEATGLLTLRGKPRAITIPFSSAAQADGNTVASGSFSLRRSDFGIGGGEWNEGDVVANDVQIRFKLTLAPAR